MLSSILTEETARPLLAQARRIKEKTGAVAPCLFYATTHNRASVVPLVDLPDDAPARQMYFASLGRQLPHIREAIFLCESWFVTTRKEASPLKQPPREHPARQEGILLAGRNRRNRRHLFALQGFNAEHGRILWQPPEFSFTPHSFSGLLDYLFAP